jgi:hypothetical protein
MTVDISESRMDKKVLNTIVFLHFDRHANNLQPKDIRGAISALCPNEILLHQHLDDNSVKYKYPLVQYKYVKGNCLLLGIEEGAKLISNLNLVGKSIVFSNDTYKILKKDTFIEEFPYGINKVNSVYSFLTPWLALNEKNYEKYQKLGGWAKRKELLEKILIGNIISMSKSLGYTVPEPIKANINNLKEVQTSLKGTPMLGFLGTFSVNFEIPDYWGIGKSVSRGFGTIIKVRSKK